MAENEELDIAKALKFYDLCLLLEKVQSANMNKKADILKNHMKSFNIFKEEFKKKNHTTNLIKCSFYPLLRLLLPDKDNARPSYGIQQKTMARIYISILNLAATSEDAGKLNNKTNTPGCRDFADIVHSVMKKRSKVNKSILTLASIHNLLDVIAESHDRAVIEQKFTEFINMVSALEQKWFIRIILKKLYLGIGEKRIFELYHPTAERFFNQNSNLRMVCESVERGDALKETAGVFLFEPIKPMRLQQLKLEFLSGILHDDFYLETKMDGERFHIHKDGEIFKYLSRGGHNFTKDFGASPSEGNLTPFFPHLLKNDVKNCILDGEMMIYDKEGDCYRSNGENIDVKSLPIGGNLRPCFVVYDILYINHNCLLDKSLAERVNYLEKIVTEQTGVLKVVNRVRVRSVEHVIELFNKALDDFEEGVVLKAMSSKYQPGRREKTGWYKLKPDYISGFLCDLDMLIVGGFYNEKKTFIKKYLVGVCRKLPATETREETLQFCSVATVGSGCKISERISLNNKLCEFWQKTTVNARDYSEFLECGNLIPDVWIDPKNSVILQIKATELYKSSSYGTSHSLRFPRIEKIRYDKPWNECMTLDEFEKYSKNGSKVVKLTKRSLNMDDVVDGNSKRSRTVNLKRKNEQNNGDVYSKKINVNEIEIVSDAGSDLTFCVCSTSKDKPSIEEIKKMIIKHGGQIVANPSLDTKKCICVAGDLTYRVKGLIKTGNYNIATVDWAVRTFSSNLFSPVAANLKPHDLICMTSDMAVIFSNIYDQFGDAFEVPIEPEELKSLFENLNKVAPPELLSSEILEFEEHLIDPEANYNFFRNICAIFYEAGEVFTLSKLILQARGGILVDSVHQIRERKKLTHLFVDKKNFDDEELAFWINEKNLEKTIKSLEIVDINWLNDCDKANQKLDISEYLLVL